MEKLTPYVRYLLILGLGYMVAQNWLPLEMAAFLLTDPGEIERQIAEGSVELLLGGAVTFWYQVSASRKALVSKDVS